MPRVQHLKDNAWKVIKRGEKKLRFKKRAFKQTIKNNNILSIQNHLDPNNVTGQS